MRILFDQGTPVALRHALVGHSIVTAYEQGWSKLTNGELLRVAEAAGFELLLTTDTNLQYQLNLRSRRIAIVVLSTTSWPRIRLATATILDAVHSVAAGGFLEVRVP